MMQLLLNEVLEDIVKKWDIKHKTIMVKTDNAPTQNKNKTKFFYLQDIANRYDARIMKIFGEAGHGKVLIDTMSSLGAKLILYPDIVTMGKWFSNEIEISNHLNLHRDKRMSYLYVEARTLYIEYIFLKLISKFKVAWQGACMILILQKSFSLGNIFSIVKNIWA